MAYGVRRGPCAGCGEYTVRRWPPGRELLCVPCAAAQAGEAARQMRDKSGPAWDRWRAAMRDYLAGELAPRG